MKLKLKNQHEIVSLYNGAMPWYGNKNNLQKKIYKLDSSTMKKISKLRLFYAASSGFILAFVPSFLLITFFAKILTTSPYGALAQWGIYLGCFLGITLWIYNSDSEFQIYYCVDCSHEWPKKRYLQERCPRCGSENWQYNYKP